MSNLVALLILLAKTKKWDFNIQDLNILVILRLLEYQSFSQQ